MSADKYPSIFSCQMETIVIYRQHCTHVQLTHLEVPLTINIFPECTWPHGGKPLSRKYNNA